MRRRPNKRQLSIGTSAFSLSEAQRILQGLKEEDDPIFASVAPQVDPGAYGSVQSTSSSHNRPPPMQASDYRDLNGNQVAPPTKRKTFASLRKKLGLGKSKKDKAAKPSEQGKVNSAVNSEEQITTEAQEPGNGVAKQDRPIAQAGEAQGTTKLTSTFLFFFLPLKGRATATRSWESTDHELLHAHHLH